MFNSTVLCALILLLSALMLHYFMVVEENFQAQRTPSRRPAARQRTRRPAAPAPAPPPVPAPAPEPTPTPAVTACPSCPACPAATAAPVTPTAAPTPSTVAPTPSIDLAKVDTTTAPAKAPVQPSMPFSELVNSLITYKPIQNAQQVYGQPLSTKASLDGTAVTNMGAVPAQELGSDVKKIRMGVKDIQNILKSDRSSTPVVPTTPAANSNALQQGNWFRSNADGACPYAMGQKADVAFRPVDDMNDYIRKDSIPCWGCTLK